MNLYERNARTLKVDALLSKVPLVDTLELREAMAVAIETQSEWRRLLVVAAGVKEPLAETWRELCAAVRSRPLATEDVVCRAAFMRRAS